MPSAPVSVIADHYDVAVRMGPVEDSELMSRRLAELEMALVASPAYRDRAGVPTASAELFKHDLIVVPPYPTRWRVGDAEVQVTPRFATSCLSAARLAALANLGIARLPLFIVAQDLSNGALVKILPDAKLPRAPATALYPRSATPSTAVRLLIEVLTAPATMTA